MRLTRRARRGMTLVEMMVAAAMCIMGMWLLTWLYQQGLESFRQARAQADLTGQQRMVTSLLTRDLKADHFLYDPSNPSNGGKRVSDQRLDQFTVDSSGLIQGYTPPRSGFFRARSLPTTGPWSYPPEDSSNVNQNESPDVYAGSTRSTNHFLHFTSILPGGSNFQQFSAEVPASSGSQYFGTAAEIAYYLSKSSAMTPNGTALYDLYRSQRIVALNSDDAGAYTTPSQQPDAWEVMVVSGGKMRTLSDLTVPSGFSQTSYRLNGPVVSNGAMVFSPQYSGSRASEDKLISNVLSFEVKFTGTANVNGYLGAVWPTPRSSNNLDYPYDTLPCNGVFDTFSDKVTSSGTPAARWNSASNFLASSSTSQPYAGESGVLKPIRITGVQIRLRTYDPRTRSTRQTTLIIDL